MHGAQQAEEPVPQALLESIDARAQTSPPMAISMSSKSPNTAVTSAYTPSELIRSGATPSRAAVDSGRACEDDMVNEVASIKRRSILRVKLEYSYTA